MSNVGIRPLEQHELPKVVEYFYAASDTLRATMGVDRAKYLPEDEWKKLLDADFEKDLRRRQFFYVGWESEGELVGHSNINNITYGDRASIHLHLWDSGSRERGLGTQFLVLSANYFLKVFELKKLICEPYADNPGPNRVVQKLGLTPVRTYECVPGWINFKQVVNRYEITEPFEG